MKLTLTLVIVLFLGITHNVFSQLPNGEIAPDFTLTDIEGNVHHLYDYLEDGKMVVLEFSATWCGPCWNYMLGGALETFWEEHGPDGDNTAMVLYIEADQSTGMDDLLGLTPSSQGNWVDAIPFPIIDLQAGENTDLEYGIAYYPTLYAVCSDKTVWELGQVGSETWSNFITSCTLDGSVDGIDAAVCYGEGGVTIDYTGGYDPVTFEWSNGDEGQNLENVGAGVYSVTITEFYDKFIVIDNIVVPGAEFPIELDEVTYNEPLCNGSSNGAIEVEYTGGTPGYQFDWSNGDDTNILDDVEAGTYTVTVTDDNGCLHTESFTLDEPDAIEVEIETTTEDCDQDNGTATLDISGGVGDYTITSSSGTVEGNQIVDLDEGVHTVTVADENGCEWEDQFEIEYLPAPEVDLVQGDELTCLQSSTTISGFASSGTGDYEYFWTTADGHIVSGHTTNTIILDEEGTYELVVTDFYSGCTVEASMTVVTQIDIPEVDAGDDLPISCENLQPVIQGSGDPLNSINWTTPDGHIVSGGDTYTPVVDEAGTYLIHVTHSGTGCSTTDTVFVNDNINPAQAAYQYQTSSLTIATTDLSTGSNLSGWHWTFGDGNTSDQQSPAHTYSVGGTYEVCLTVQNGCGPSTSCLQVEVAFEGTVLSLVGEIFHVLCHGDANGAISLTVNGGSGNYTFSWTGPDGSSYSTEDITDLPAGEYTVVVSDDQGNTIIDSYTVTQPDAISIGASTVTDNLCYGQAAGAITVEMSGGVAPYLYSWNGGAPQQENFIDELQAGVYECLVTDANGCQLLVGPYIITQPDEINVVLTEVNDATNEELNNGSITIEVNGGIAPYTVNWSNGASGLSIQGLVPGTYTYTIVDANGCLLTSVNPIVINQSTSTIDPAIADLVDIVPNPSRGEVVIKWKDIVSANASLTLLTVDGRRLSDYKIKEASGSWDLTSLGLSEGLYIIMINQGDRSYPLKLVIL